MLRSTPRVLSRIVGARAYSGISDRGKALEDEAVRRHDQELLRQLREKQASKGGEKGGLQNVSVIGGGLMGAGIAQVSAQSGFNVTLIDMSPAVLAASEERIGASLARVAKKQQKDDAWLKEVRGRISTTTEVADGVKNADLVVEAIVEDLQVKWELFSQVCKAAPSTAVLASNTSSLSIGEIANATGNPGRVGGLHFFNPVPVMKLLEVVSAKHTTQETARVLTEFGEKLGKTVIQCRDTPGFVVNRLLVPLMAEAMRLVERGDASTEAVDVGMKLGAGHPMGPLTLADYVGLDTCKFIMDGWQESYPDQPLFRTPEILNKLVSQGHIGNKGSSGGFYVNGKPRDLSTL